MLFTTLEYAAFFGVVVIMHWLLPRPVRRYWLLAASYFFYTRTFPQYGWLIAAMTVWNYLLGLLIWRVGQRPQQAKPLARALLVAGIAGNLATLAFFKYAALLLSTCWPALRVILRTSTPLPPTLAILLPLGISFFTFEFIHYLVEIARGHAPIRDPFEFALFAAFFPTQIAGPIKRFPDWVKARAVPTRLRDIKVDTGIWLIVRGMAKKIIIADQLSPLVASGFGHPERLGIAATWLVILAFAAQIYADFSGYTDIGRGCALLLGFTTPENFRNPYQAADPSEFWERWHISLSRWLRDYLFIPLGGSRVVEWRVALNLMITMGLGGLWHGASWHYMVWGLYQGGLLVATRAWKRQCARAPRLARVLATPHSVLLGRVVTFALVCLGWLFFRADTPALTATMLRHAIHVTSPLAPLAGYAHLLDHAALGLPSVILALWIATVVGGWLWAWFDALLPRSVTPSLAAAWVLWQPWLQPVAALAILTLVAIWPAGQAQTFIYFQF